MTSPRREFLKTTTAIATATVLCSTNVSSGVEKGSDLLRIGLIGCRGMGTNHLKLLSGRKDVQIGWVCDVDSQRLDASKKIVSEVSKTTPPATGDLRRVLDDGEIDAVFIATPDHRHAPAAILADGECLGHVANCWRIGLPPQICLHIISSFSIRYAMPRLR